MQNKKNKLRKLWLNLKNQITMDKIKNKIQLETINVNKKNANKRRWTKLKEKIYWRARLIFYMACMQINE